jgi:cell division protein YceG involved in septum cleavage
MDRNLKTVLLILVVIGVLALVIRGCQQVKGVKITQKSNDTASKLSVEIEKQKE